MKYRLLLKQQLGGQERARLRIKRKHPPSPYQKEVSDAGFAYTNQVCLAIEDSRLLPSLSRELLAQALSLRNVYAVGPTASQTACIMRQSLWSCLLARLALFVVSNQQEKFPETYLFDMGRGDFSSQYFASRTCCAPRL